MNYNIKINGREYEFKKNITILQACSKVGIEIPRFCYHDKLSIAGNCRMCLVEVKNSPKPVASCAMGLIVNMEIYTNSEKVKKAREGILEFLLANHPLDCPVCDQGGECDLQDQAMVFGSDRGRFYEFKRAVDDKHCGSFIKTSMNRCIHCTRCVRFFNEIGGSFKLGVVGRGNKMEIGTYIKNFIDSEISGNVIDLCPVGALTSKPYAFITRPWELKSVNSLDIFDSMGSNIRIDFRGSEIVRILPRLNNDINENWISDKVRFSYDFINKQRLLTPLLNNKGFLINISWKKAFNLFRDELFKEKRYLKGVLGNFIDIESLVCFKYFLSKFGNYFIDFELDSCFTNNDLRTNYLLNLDYSELSNINYIVLVGINLRLENPVFNSKVRKLFLNGNLFIFNIGINYNLGYYVRNLGNNFNLLINILEGRSWLCNILWKNSVFFFGNSFLSRNESFFFLGYLDYINNKVIKYLKKGKINYGFIYKNITEIGFMEYGLFNLKKKELKDIKMVKYLLNVGYYKKDKYDVFTVYQGFIGDVFLDKVDLILPGCSFMEKNSLYINYKGMVQEAKRVFLPYYNSRIDWEIIYSLSSFIGNELFKEKKINNFIRKISPLKVNKEFIFINREINNVCMKFYVFRSVFKSIVVNFYKSDLISRNSFNLLIAYKNMKKKNSYN